MFHWCKSVAIVAVTFFMCMCFGLAKAEIEKIAVTNSPRCAEGIHFLWWPKLTEIKGWHHDRNASDVDAVNALAPDGFTFKNAESVIYAKASYKPRMPETKSLEQFISDDHEEFLNNYKNLKIVRMASLTTADGQVLPSYKFIPMSEGNWEQVAYGEEGEFYLIFTLSSRSQKGFDNALSAYEQLVSKYKENQ